ncbi:MAG: hypothetical protein WD603_01495 [Patescibacteria group bacterium]
MTVLTIAPGDIYDPPDEDAKAFVTYKNYADAFLWIAKDQYPTFTDQATFISAQPGASKARPTDIKPEEIASLLQGAWSTELLMAESLETATNAAIRYANVWSPIQAYYAVFSAGRAYLKAAGSKATSHRSVLNDLTGRLSRRDLALLPWNATANGCPQIDQVTYQNLGTTAGLDISNLTVPRSTETAWGVFAKSLKTTRADQCEEDFSNWIRNEKPKTATGKRRKNVLKADKERIAGKLPSTSIFHLMYRVRIRANYKQTDSFAVGAITPMDSRKFYESQMELTARNLFTFECLVLGIMGRRFLRAALLKLASIKNPPPAIERWKPFGVLPD